MSLTICCSCEVYGGDALACARAAGARTPCPCDCHRATHETVSVPKGRLTTPEDERDPEDPA